MRPKNQWPADPINFSGQLKEWYFKKIEIKAFSIQAEREQLLESQGAQANKERIGFDAARKITKGYPMPRDRD